MMTWPQVSLTELDVYIERRETIIEEHPPFMRYITPHFVAKATGSISPLIYNSQFSIGWVQAVTAKREYNKYINPCGYTFWLIPPLRYGPVSDSNGINYPWYGITNEYTTLKGPTDYESHFSVSMDDNFTTQVTWEAPVDLEEDKESLVQVYREQSFQTWLILKNDITNDIGVLLSYTWEAVIDIGINCSLPVGQRCTLLEPRLQSQPTSVLLKDQLIIPEVVLHSPNANSVQTLVWIEDQDM